METISIIVPCYNEEESIPLFYTTTKAELQKIEGVNYEFIFVNDGSTDQSIHELKLLALQDANCHYISFSRNFGKESAMFAGLQKATGEYCVIMDADLQHPPTLLKEMYQVLKYENYDCAAGKRMDRTGEGGLRSFLSKQFYKVISRLTKMDMSDGSGDFRMMRRVMVDAILQMKEYNRYMKGIFSFVGFDTKWIEFHNVERVAGQTKWNLKSLFSYAFEGIVSFSTKPLLFAGIVGTILLGISTILGMSIIIRLCLSQVISSSFYLLTLLVFLSSLQMIFVSILGQYVSKDYLENKKRPIYIIKESDL